MGKKLKAEIWDRVQYIFRNYYDRMIHGALYFDGNINEENLRKVLYKIIGHYPVFRSSFKSSCIRPYWKVNEEFNEKELLKVVECDDLPKSVCKALAREINVKEKFQYEIVLHKCGDKCALSILVNHMCLDGSDFKYFMGKIREGYNLLEAGKSLDELTLKYGSRGYKQLYKDMSEEDAKKAKGLYVNVSRTGIKNKFDFSDDKDCRTRFNFAKLSPDELDSLKKKGKTLGASVNDLFITAFARAISKQMVGTDKRIAITNMKNLRDHIKSHESENMTNLTGFMPCVVENVEGTFEDTLALVCQKTKKAKEDKYLGLYGLPLMALAFRLFPFSIAELAIKIGYENPLIGMSNIGIIDESITAYSGLKCYDAFITGATKFKPYIQLTSTTLNGEVTLCIAEKCSDEDERRIRVLLSDIKQELMDFLG